MPTLDNAHALVVQITGYHHIARLPHVQDARDISALLIDPGRCGYLPANVELLLDDQATQAGIRQALARLAQRSNADSTVFVYFSGHGGGIESGPCAGQYLLPVDTVYPTDEDLARTAISGDEFSAALKAIAARKVVVVFDCCHASGIGQPRNIVPRPFTAGLPDRYYSAALKTGVGRVLMASSRSSELSHVLPGATYGLFTEHLLGGLRGGVAGADGLIRIFDLFEYIQPPVTAARPEQHPVFKAEVEENFPVALYLGGQKGIVPAATEEYRYDAYISYADQEPDSSWVWNTLLPRLEKAGLRVAVSGDVEQPGVARVVGVERGIRQAKRTVIVLSEAYLADGMANFENVLGQTLDVQEGTYRLLPVKIAAIEQGRLPARLGMLTPVDVTRPRRAEREMDRLVRALQDPLPRR
jgi:hypothetical protein